MGMTGPGKDKFYTMTFMYCLFSVPTPSRITPYPKLECELHEGRKFCLFG